MNIGTNQAAMICNHVFDGAPILKAVKDAPLDDTDSGWQCHCNKVDHTQETSAKFISVRELLEIEPSLQLHMDSPIGTVLERDGPSNAWRIATG